MAKWTLPEGGKPLTDADIAALIRRLAGTAVDYKELYEAAKRDAEEAEAYAAELEAKMKWAVEALTRISLAERNSGTKSADLGREARTTLAGLKGQDDE